MTGPDPGRVEDAVLAILGGAPVEDTARTTGITAPQLAAAVEQYRTAGRAALDTARTGWHQVNIRFTDHEHAERAFRAYLAPALRAEPVGPWWFVRKAPYWRLRYHPAPGVGTQDAIDHVTSALDSSVSWGVTAHWKPALYEPETVAFGGPTGLPLAHALFHTDSNGVLDYLHTTETEPSRVLERRETSLLAMTTLLRGARLELGEQGDVWAHVEQRRPLPDDIAPERIDSMVKPMERLLLTDTRPLVDSGPLAPVRAWFEALDDSGQRLADAAEDGQLTTGKRSILARHVLFHWNRMGFTTRQQAIWTRAAREAATSG
ncbi:thiopeptide-type bacteriocin biosynthesis protein [Streptomyces sp. NPDC054784]